MLSVTCLDMLPFISPKSIGREQQILNCVANGTHILGRMKAEEQLPCEDSINDYSKAWSEHIDRGGLCHIKSEVSIDVVDT